MLQVSYVEHCKLYNWDFVSTAPKAGIKHIIAAQPPARKSRIADALRLEKNNLKDEVFGFSTYVAEQARSASRSTHFVESLAVRERVTAPDPPRMVGSALPCNGCLKQTSLSVQAETLARPLQEA